MTAETPGGGGLTEAERITLCTCRKGDRTQRCRERIATVERIKADAAVQARAEVVARVEAVLDAPGRHDRHCAIRDAVDATCSCWRGQLRAALAGPNPRGGQDGGGE